MKLEDIQSLWREDAKIDRYNLTDESLKCPLLHSKYWEIFLVEKHKLNDETENFKNFELAKITYYNGKMGEEELKKMGWKAFNILLAKGDIPKAVDGDTDIIRRKLQIQEQSDKVEFVKAILQSIGQRTYVIKNALQNLLFESGA